MSAPRLSVIIPVRDEAGNIAPLVAELEAALGGVAFEILYVDDGSTDATRSEVAALCPGRPHLRLLALDANAGKAEAQRAGARAAAGELVVLMDGDGQNDPADIPRLLAAFDAGDPAPGLVLAQRVGRQDTAFKRWQSRAANAIRRRLLKDDTRDAGCGFALLPRAVYLALPQFDGLHRFLPALVRRERREVRFVEVRDRPRRAGRSKYGFFDRLWVGLDDMLGVMWLVRRRRYVPRVEETGPG